MLDYSNFTGKSWVSCGNPPGVFLVSSMWWRRIISGLTVYEVLGERDFYTFLSPPKTSVFPKKSMKSWEPLKRNTILGLHVWGLKRLQPPNMIFFNNESFFPKSNPWVSKKPTVLDSTFFFFRFIDVHSLKRILLMDVDGSEIPRPTTCNVWNP